MERGAPNRARDRRSAVSSWHDAAMPGVRPVPVDLDELIIEMTAGEAFRGQLAYLDTRTGAIVYVSPDRADGFEVAEHLAPILRLEGREQYEVMTRFAAGESEPDTAALLRFALHGKGAFRRFREVLRSHRDLGRRWRAYEASAVRTRAVEWLRSIGIEPVEPTAVRGGAAARSVAPLGESSVIDLVDLLLRGTGDRDPPRSGRTSRKLHTRSPDHARRVFESLAKDLARLCEVPWPDSLADRPVFEVGRFSLRCEGASVELQIEDPPSSTTE